MNDVPVLAAIGSKTAFEGTAFNYGVNATDVDGGALTFKTNSTLFTIAPSTGIISFTPTAAQIGTYSINISVNDTSGAEDSEIIALAITNSNDAPVLSEIGSQVATEGTVFDLDVDATDSEGDTLVFASNSTIFTINSATGMINFTPSLSDVGNHTINITVFDGFLYDYEVISFRVARGPYCGDVSCGNGENCGRAHPSVKCPS